MNSWRSMACRGAGDSNAAPMGDLSQLGSKSGFSMGLIPKRA
jgi:hypothetical protein